MSFNWKGVSKVFGILLYVQALFILIGLVVSLILREAETVPFIKTLGIDLILATALFYNGKDDKRLFGKKEGFFIVSMTWVIFTLIGMLPFLFSGSIHGLTNAFFETMSGFTTAGSSIMENVDQQSRSILFWRSLIQWMGGMGIIVLTVAILPMFGISGMKLFSAESSGITLAKLRPHIADTAKHLWLIYASLTLIQTILLWIGPMDFFDAICHSFTTMASGGYSTKQASIAYWNSPYIEYVISIFMIIAGVNFGIIFHALHNKREKLYQNEELRWYLAILAIATALIAIGLWITGQMTGIEQTLRVSLFQVSSMMSTTGYSTADYVAWGPYFGMILLIVMFIGGSAGSTAGGVKVVRIILSVKNTLCDFKRQAHPNAVIPVRLDNAVIPNHIITGVLSFIVLYSALFIIGAFGLLCVGLGLEESIGASMTSISIVGPGLGTLGPSSTFAAIPDTAKWIMSFLMLAGRLELFTLLVLITPSFWKK